MREVKLHRWRTPSLGSSFQFPAHGKRMMVHLITRVLTIAASTPSGHKFPLEGFATRHKTSHCISFHGMIQAATFFPVYIVGPWRNVNDTHISMPEVCTCTRSPACTKPKVRKVYYTRSCGGHHNFVLNRGPSQGWNALLSRRADETNFVEPSCNSTCHGCRKRIRFI